MGSNYLRLTKQYKFVLKEKYLVQKLFQTDSSNSVQSKFVKYNYEPLLKVCLSNNSRLANYVPFSELIKRITDHS